jgi:hypothetical protein
VLRRQGCDRVIEYPQVICGGVRSGAAWPEHPGQRLGGVVAVSQQRVMAKPLEVRLRALLVGVRRDHRGV